MCNQVDRFIACFSLGVALLAFGEVAFCKPKLWMVDPIFGIKYDPQEVHFEAASKSAFRKCEEIKKRDLWIYAHWEDKGSKFYIVSGFLTSPVGPQNSAARHLEADVAGVVVAISNGVCAVGTPDMALRGEFARTRNVTTVQLEQIAIDQLSTDAVRRYISAFGGKDRFLAVIRMTKGLNSAELPPAIRSRIMALQ